MSPQQLEGLPAGRGRWSLGARGELVSRRSGAWRAASLCNGGKVVGLGLTAWPRNQDPISLCAGRDRAALAHPLTPLRVH